MIRINRKAWHYRLYNFIAEGEVPKDLCGYLMGLGVGLFCLAALAAMAAGVMYLFGVYAHSAFRWVTEGCTVLPKDRFEGFVFGSVLFPVGALFVASKVHKAHRKGDLGPRMTRIMDRLCPMVETFEN